MASRWMQQMQARERRYKKKLANISLTEIEKRFYRRKIRISQVTGRIVYVEEDYEHAQRMMREATEESHKPKEPHRIISRIQQIESIVSVKLNYDEREIIRRKLIKDERGRVYLDPKYSIHDVEESILRYRRLTGR